MYNLISYLIYAVIICSLILRIGHICHRYGKVYIAGLMKQDKETSDRINNLLLAGYYLLNIGYGIYGISNWETVRSPARVITTVAEHLAAIILLLAVIHYLNMITIKFIYTFKN